MSVRFQSSVIRFGFADRLRTWPLSSPRFSVGLQLCIWCVLAISASAAEKVALPPPAFSVSGGVLTEPIELKLTLAGAATADAVIRFTVDGKEPTANSTLFTAPLTVAQSTRVRARTFHPDGSSSAVASEDYTFLGPGFRRIDSELPLIVIDTFGQAIPHRSTVTGAFRIIEPGESRASITEAPAWSGWVEISQRGNTSRQFPKRSYTIKLTGSDGRPRPVALGGMPADSDWVLYAPYFDRTLLRDVLAYDLSNRIGRYAPRTRFVEVFVAERTRKIENPNYLGVYVLTEKIKLSQHRVALSVPGANVSQPDSPPGFLFKMDHVDPDETGFRTSRGRRFLYVRPRERDVTGEQSAWLIRQLDQFERALYGREFTNPMEGYARFLDVDSFIDYFWLVEMSKCVDGFRFSTYLTLQPGGKLKMGPIWDWDQSFGNANFYDGDSPEGWYWPFIRDTEIDWFARLCKDPEFRRRYTARWFELRRGAFATAEIMNRVDALVTSMGEARQRNSSRWPTRREHHDYVNQMKRWIQHRVDWIDQQLAASAIKSPKADAVAGE